jgi:hypothetical protein
MTSASGINARHGADIYYIVQEREIKEQKNGIKCGLAHHECAVIDGKRAGVKRSATLCIRGKTGYSCYK